MSTPSWCSIATPRVRHAAPARRRWGRSIARPTSASISTSAFFDDLASRFHAPGQFPQAYVIAHEVGHHVQNLLGITGKVEQMRQSMSKRDANALSVRVELQADCFAGVWANRAEQKSGGKMIDDKDVDQALAAASAIGDDRLQKQAQGRIVPDSFTHGSSAQRTRWFRKGLDSGDPNQCDTFRAQQL